ncbi:hypothetical protein CXG81DRAFT_18811 [Caulochytrium protostelioides]|uniref:Uncharacterized protein n=1 Tax=Caulochytrium protostelioides TaxID=1555241 RepID=A0A4P9X8T9_9FUNG|nr:hypothetical protein CXG81DRAFT_18811 [Caulochytrium protostelioides]|eukprot:RKP01391.1 hypothetical protein CXG81DRAFT_18811 [Caulochytrium protostelioides]
MVHTKDETYYRLAVEAEETDAIAYDIIGLLLSRLDEQIYEAHIESQILPYATLFARDTILDLIRWEFFDCDDGAFLNAIDDVDAEPPPALPDSLHTGRVPVHMAASRQSVSNLNGGGVGAAGLAAGEKQGRDVERGSDADSDDDDDGFFQESGNSGGRGGNMNNTLGSTNFDRMSIAASSTHRAGTIQGSHRGGNLTRSEHSAGSSSRLSGMSQALRTLSRKEVLLRFQEGYEGQETTARLPPTPAMLREDAIREADSKILNRFAQHAEPGKSDAIVAFDTQNPAGLVFDTEGRVLVKTRTRPPRPQLSQVIMDVTPAAADDVAGAPSPTSITAKRRLAEKRRAGTSSKGAAGGAAASRLPTAPRSPTAAKLGASSPAAAGAANAPKRLLSRRSDTQPIAPSVGPPIVRSAALVKSGDALAASPPPPAAATSRASRGTPSTTLLRKPVPVGTTLPPLDAARYASNRSYIPKPKPIGTDVNVLSYDIGASDSSLVEGMSTPGAAALLRTRTDARVALSRSAAAQATLPADKLRPPRSIHRPKLTAAAFVDEGSGSLERAAAATKRHAPSSALNPPTSIPNAAPASRRSSTLAGDSAEGHAGALRRHSKVRPEAMHDSAWTSVASAAENLASPNASAPATPNARRPSRPPVTFHREPSG